MTLEEIKKGENAHLEFKEVSIGVDKVSIKHLPVSIKCR